MSGLFAEKRMDSRGFLVTRHVRRDASASSKSLGKAALTPLFGKDDRFPGNFKEKIKDHTGHLPKPERKALMATLNPDTFLALHAIGLGQDEDGVTYTSDSALNHALRTCVEERSFALLNNIAIFAYEGEEPYPFHLFDQLVPQVKGISQYQSEDETERKDYSTATDEEVHEARRLMNYFQKAMNAITGTCAEMDYNFQTGEGKGWFFSNPLLVEMIASEAEQIPKMFELIDEHHAAFKTDEDIRNLLDMATMQNETPTVLHDGLL